MVDNIYLIKDLYSEKDNNKITQLKNGQKFKELLHQRRYADDKQAHEMMQSLVIWKMQIQITLQYCTNLPEQPK